MGKWKDERERDVARKRANAKSAKTVVVPDCEDRLRREGYEADDEAWLRYYCGELFWYAFTPQQKAMIEAISNAIVYGGDQALAASRGEGKTVLFERMLLKYTLQGTIKFSVLFGASHEHAINSLQSMRDEVEKNERLGKDYPEVCVPVQALEDTPNRAHYQLVTGRRHDNGEVYEAQSSRFTWCGNEIIFPNVPGSPAAWGVIATRGLDGAVRGLRKKNQRPQVVGIDDPDTDETVANPIQAAKLEKRIDRGIAGLGGQQRGVARIMLTTLQSPDCVSAWFTDPNKKPSFKGRRFRFLIKKPTRMDLWEQYVEMRKEDQKRKENDIHVDEHARRAHQFYLDNRAVMDEGSEVANPHRFNPQILPDGTQLEVSSLQRYFNEVARLGPEAVATEYDNDPPAETNFDEAGITPAIVAQRVNGLERREIPADCAKLIPIIDLGKRWCHWLIQAWTRDCAGFVVDYGVSEVHGTDKEDDQKTIDLAVLRSLLDWLDWLRRNPFSDSSGNTVPYSIGFIDSGTFTGAAYEFCRQSGGLFKPTKGHGEGRYRQPAARTATRVPGDHWNRSYLAGERLWLYHLDSDFWKGFAHDRFMTSTFDDRHILRPGSMSLWSPTEPREHHSFSQHVCSEVFQRRFIEGKGERAKWWKKSANNHWLDCTYMGCAAASVEGIRLMGTQQALKVHPSQRPTAASIAAMAKRA